jgi:hypothetical protein
MRSFIFGVAMMAMFGSTLAKAEVLPACGNEASIKSALKLAIEQRTGVVNQSVADVMTVESAQPLGINKQDDSKTCRVVFRCDTTRAKEMEKDIIGRHPLSQFCWSMNYLSDTGNGAMMFSVRPDGEGGYLISMLPNEGFFDEVFKAIKPRTEVAPPPSTPIPVPPALILFVGEGPMIVNYGGILNRVTWQNTDHRKLVVYQVIVKDEANNLQIFDAHHGLGNFPQSFGFGGEGWVDSIPNAVSAVFVTNRGTFEYKKVG